MNPHPAPSPSDACFFARPCIVTRLVAVLLCVAAPLRAGWGEDSIRKECDYIVDCSFTTFAQNNSQAQTTDNAYGCINVVRIGGTGHADWVPSGESAMAAIGLMAGAQRLRTSGENIDTYKTVLTRFFNTWMIGSGGRAFDTTTTSATYGGAYSRIYYTVAGAYSSAETPNSTTTAQLVCAAWKYYEFLKNIGDNAGASAWLAASWPKIKRAGDFLKNSYNSTHKLTAGRPAVVNTGDLWITDSAMSHVAYNCLERYCAVGGFTRPFSYTTYAANVKAGIEGMKDTGSWKNFHRFRDRSAGYALSYGSAVDQLCHLPYEADVIVPGTYCKSVCDWWLANMTHPTTNSADWRYYGTTWHLYFDGAPENDYLYPGPGLQLAKTEWKYYKVTGDTAYRSRAANRLAFADSTARSNLWLGSNGGIEAGVPNGIVDWRSALDYNAKAGNWARFADTSAYFIEVVLMVVFDTDTTYQPVL